MRPSVASAPRERSAPSLDWCLHRVSNESRRRCPHRDLAGRRRKIRLSWRKLLAAYRASEMPCNRIFVITQLTLVIRVSCSERATEAADAETRITLQKSQRVDHKRKCDRDRRVHEGDRMRARRRLHAYAMRSIARRTLPIKVLSVDRCDRDSGKRDRRAVFFVSSSRADVCARIAREKNRSRSSASADRTGGGGQDFDGLRNG